MVIVTEWVQFRALDLERLKREMAQPVVVDLRNIYRPEDMAALGFTYESIGRAPQRGTDTRCVVPHGVVDVCSASVSRFVTPSRLLSRLSKA